MYKFRFISTRFPEILVGAVVAGLIGTLPVTAQSSGEVKVLDDSNLTKLSAPDADNQDFVRGINACFRTIPALKDPEANVDMQIELNRFGDFAGVLVLAKDSLSPSRREILRATLIALADCTPLQSSAASGSYFITASIDGLVPMEQAPIPPLLLSETPDLKSVPSQVVKAVKPAADSTTAQSAAAGTQASEKALNLTRHGRREIQRRLTLIGYDTNGIDGVFGKGTRQAIGNWQQGAALPSSGFLDRPQLALLKQKSATKYAIWDAKPKRYYDKKGCLREPNGRVVLGRTALCDLGAIFQ